MKSFHIETERLILRNILPTDVDGMFELDSDPKVHRYLGNNPITSKNQSEKVIQSVIKQYEEIGIGRWAMVNKQTNEFIGWSGLKLNTITLNGHTNFFDVGYRIIRKFWGNGYATEALREIIKFGFSGSLPCGALNRIQGDTVPGNVASEAVLKKIGFKEEGLLRESGYWKGRFHDLNCFGLIKSEYNEI